MSATLLRGGRVVGGDSRTGGSTGRRDVLVEDGRVTAVADRVADDLVREAGVEEVVDLDGRFVVPGLWDEHVHSEQWALLRRRIDVASARSARDVARLLADHLREHPPVVGDVVVGYGYRDALWADVPHRDLLDAVAPDVPVALTSGDLHGLWLNRAAQARFGVTEHPTGVLLEAEAAAVQREVDATPVELLDRWIADAVEAASARGVVGVRELERPWAFDDWTRRVGAGTDGLRVECAFYPERMDEVVARGLRQGDAAPGTGGLVTVGPFKVLVDGSLNTRTARCHDPYPGHAGSEAHGLVVTPPDVLVPLMRRAARHGLGSTVHAIGDEAVTLVLDAFEEVGTGGRMEHAQLVTDADLPRFARLGVVASVQPAHAVDDRDVADHHWAGRTGRAFAFASLHAAGATLAIGSDAPVAPLDPWVSMAAAVYRSAGDRAPWHPEQHLSLDVALAACAGGRSTVRTGDVADLAVVEADPATVEPAALREMPVAGTLLAGRWTHRTAALG